MISFWRDVSEEVASPSVRDGGAVRDNEDALCVDFLGELVGGDGFAEARLCVPEELAGVFRRMRGRILS